MTTKQQQLLLIYLGYDPGELDGIPGPNTERATKKFQKDYGLEPDGICGAQTQKMLTAAVAGIAEPVATGTNVGGNTDWWGKYKNFTRSEFACKCGGQYCDGFPAEPAEKLVALLQKIRDHYGKAVHPVSGLRCERWNKIQGGVANSRHRLGQAVDFWISGESPEAIVAWVQANCPECAYTYAIRRSDGTLAGTVHVDVVL